MTRLACFFLVLIFGSGSVSAEAKRALKPEDYAGLKEVEDPQLSPDGQSIVYIVGTTDLEKDKSASNLWLARFDGSDNHALTFGMKNQTHPRWSPDGKWIAFLSAREDDKENNQLWIMRSDGGEAEKLTDEKGSVDDFAWAPDSQHFALVILDPDPRDAEKEDSKGSKEEDKTPPPLVIDRYSFKQDITGYLTAHWSHLHLLDRETREVTALTSGNYDDLLPAWSPDGKSIAFASKRGDDPDRTENWDVYLIEAKKGAKERQLTQSPEADCHPDWEASPAWSPDGKWIAYLHGDDPKKIEYGVHSLAIILAAGGEPRTLTPKLDRNINQPLWAADSQSILATVETDGTIPLLRFPIDGSEPQTVIEGKRTVKGFDSGPSGNIVANISTPERPSEIFASEHGKLREITKLNDEFLAQFKLGKVEEMHWKSTDGAEIHGFLVHPADEVTGQKYPTLLHPHGGPQWQYSNEFYFDEQLMASNGYAVILPNPRGSTGRGADFGMAIYADWGGVAMQDDLTAVDAAIAQGVADPDRLGVGGWSYGGISTNYLIASTDRFKAATSGASISNAFAGFGTDQYTRDYVAELGLPWKNPAAYERVSYPFLHADKIKTPTLFLCGEEDFNVPLLNSEQMYQALKILGVPTQLIIYPGQNHSFTTPSYNVDCNKRYLDWFGKWLKPEKKTGL